MSATRAERVAALGRRGATVWFTGLPASGKTTTATALERSLLADGIPAYVLDGDVLRTGLTRDLGFDAASRAESVRRAGEAARLLAEAGTVALVSLVSPYRAHREMVRGRHAAGGIGFLEVWVSTPLEVCEARDPKGLYAKARAGELTLMTGIDDPYEAPERPHVEVHTGEQDTPATVAALRALLDPLIAP